MGRPQAPSPALPRKRESSATQWRYCLTYFVTPLTVASAV
jgi:hypothetical protein